jgi:hypothetical protein
MLTQVYGTSFISVQMSACIKIKMPHEEVGIKYYKTAVKQRLFYLIDNFISL